jgi:uncharacterized protein YjiS (DUF1127 family)
MDNSTAISARELRLAAPARTTGLAIVASTISRCVAWIRDQERIRQDTNRLMTLDDRLLADIGLERDQVEHALRSGRLPARRDDAGIW